MSHYQDDILEYYQLINVVITLFGLLIVLLAFIFFRARMFTKQQAVSLERLVHERTLELKKYVETLQGSQAERTFLLEGISKRINACLATMKGLSRIAMTYENMPPELVENIEITADTLADILQQIAREKRLQK